MDDDDCSGSQISETQEIDNAEDQLVEKGEEALQSSNCPSSSRDDEESKDEDLKQQISELKTTVKFLSHQMTMIMSALHVPSCSCDLCSSRQHNRFNGELDTSLVMGNGGGLGSEYGQSIGGGKIAPMERRAVSDYALQHGGIAAVRRFGIRAPVSSYYQRKDSKTALGGGNSPGPSNDDDRNGEGENGLSMGGNRGMDAMLKMTSASSNSAAHTSGSPGFLRGRGRGRPKLIGDELDADLVEYMVQVKNTDPNLHLSASQALEIAKGYIMEKAPGLLEEHGGHVKLKLTWAMKLVSRIAERQKEIELGLPAGTLQNMGKSQQIAEMVAMTKFGGGLMGGGGNGGLMGTGGGGGMGDMRMDMVKMEHGLKMEHDDTNGLNDNINGQHQVVATPEIVSVRELDLSHLSSGSHTSSHQSIHHHNIPSTTTSSMHSNIPMIGANGEILFSNQMHH